jgi:RNA polymerase sigma factor (sigma-70 family)
VQTLFRDGTNTGLSDGELLDRFLAGPEDVAESAFEALVERHGPMVLRVCRRIVGDRHEAEDASQAAFLVLAQKASSIRKTASVAGWLCGVACRTSARAKARVTRSRWRQPLGEQVLAGLVDERKERQDWQELYEELGKLPERFRLPIVLCHLEGHSYERAAQLLGCPLRTVQSRLARGRGRLRERLIRRGVAPVVSLPVWSLDAGAAAVPGSFSQATVKAALALALRANTLTRAATSASGLAKAVIEEMRLATLTLSAALAATLFVSLGLGAIAARSQSTGSGTPGHREDVGSGAVAALGQESSAGAASNRYRATFRSGAAVEVVGVSTVPTAADTWCKPDGSPLSEAPVDRIESRFSVTEARGSRVIVLRVSGVKPDDSFRWLTTRYGSYWGGQPRKNGRPATGLEYYEVVFSLDPTECDVAARLADGDWTVAASDEGKGGVGMVKDGQHFDFGKARSITANGRPGTAMAVGHKSNRDKRLVAVDQKGMPHVGVHSIAPFGEGNSLLDAEFDLPPDQIKEYQVQFRPFEQVVISGIKLQRRIGDSSAKKVRAIQQEPSPAPERETPTRARIGEVADVDSDGDGLSDFQEIHKYRTDPGKFSTAGDGVSDGDWQRRRGFTYSIRSIVKVMPPVNLDALNDDYQDARVLSRSDHFVELEVVHYPLNTNAEAIRGNRDWRRDTGGMQQYLAPGITTNWDATMQRDLVAALRADGIDLDRLDDKELVTRAAAWLLAKSKFVNMFCTHYMYYPGGKVTIYPGLDRKFESDKGDRGWTVQEQLDHELFGKSMFANLIHGTCTSTAVFLTTALRALGIPTRMVLGIPLVDGNDSAQIEMANSAIHHHRVRQVLLSGLSSTQGYANHTFNEVFVGGRWARLNYSKLGQNTLDANTMGLLTHVNTFNDLSEVPLAETWGKRYALGERDAVFRYGNPYRCVELSDHFGKFAKVENPEAREHRAMTISRAYWADDPEAPARIQRAKRPRGNRDHGPVQLFFHADEWFDDQPWQQLKIFLQAAGKEFLFQAEGQPDVLGRTTAGSCTDPAQNVREIEVILPRDEYAKMKPGIAYRIVPRNEVSGYEWKVKGRLTITCKP